MNSLHTVITGMLKNEAPWIDLPDDKKVCLMVALILSCKMFTLALTWLFLNLKCNVPQEEAEKATAPFLDALDDDYAVPCDGMCNLFLSSYSFQSTAMCFSICPTLRKSGFLVNFLLSGTAFFPLQSCMNHSCCPNAKAFKRDEVMYILPFS